MYSGHSYFSHFKVEKTEAQNDDESCPASRIKNTLELELKFSFA